MFVVAEPLKRPNTAFRIIHNGIEYVVDSAKMSETSGYFSDKLAKIPQKAVEIKDMHSETAFSTFIKLCTYQRCIIDFDEQIEISSLLDEWKCPQVQELLSHTLTDNPLFGEKSEPFKEISADKDVETPRKIEITSTDNRGIVATPKNSPVKGNVTPKESPKNEERMKEGDIKLIKVHVKSRIGSLYTIQILNSMPVLSLKKMILLKTSIDTEKQVLIFNGKIMSDEKILFSCGITDNSIVYLERTDPGDSNKEIVITLKHQTSEDVPYLIAKNKKVSDLISMIKNKEKLTCSVSLIYNGKKLNNDSEIGASGLEMYSAVLLICSE